MIFDVLIIGGGLVGASLSAALKSSGLSVALVEAQPLTAGEQGWDNRIYAISPGSAAFLTECGAWQGLSPRMPRYWLAPSTAGQLAPPLL